MPNDLSVVDIYQVANQIFKQALGSSPLGTINAQNFVTVAQHALKTAYDPLMQAVSQVLSNTVFAERPYDEKFMGMEASNLHWGNWTRKIQFGEESPAKPGLYLSAQNGQSIDQYTVYLPPVYETAYYGQDFLTYPRTIKYTGLETAFTSASELEQFISKELLYTSNNIKQVRENLKRNLLANFIAAKIQVDSANVIHLLSEYNAYRGFTTDATKLTATTVTDPEVYGDFIRWCYGRIAGLCQLMTERSVMFHLNPAGMNIIRQTGYRNQRIYLLSQAEGLNQIQANVLSMTFQNQYLKLPYTELVNYWQNITDPGSIAVTPTYMTAAGTPVTGNATVEQSNIFGVILDSDACIINFYADRQSTTPYNAAGEYYNIFWRQNYRFGCDITENGIVLLMD